MKLHQLLSYTSLAILLSTPVYAQNVIHAQSLSDANSQCSNGGVVTAIGGSFQCTLNPSSQQDGTVIIDKSAAQADLAIKTAEYNSAKASGVSGRNLRAMQVQVDQANERFKAAQSISPGMQSIISSAVESKQQSEGNNACHEYTQQEKDLECVGGRSVDVIHRGCPSFTCEFDFVEQTDDKALAASNTNTESRLDEDQGLDFSGDKVEHNSNSTVKAGVVSNTDISSHTKKLYDAEAWGDNGSVEADFAAMKEECQNTQGVYKLNGQIRCGHNDVASNPDAEKINGPSDLVEQAPSSSKETVKDTASAEDKLVSEHINNEEKLLMAQDAYEVAKESGDTQAMRAALGDIQKAESDYLKSVKGMDKLGLSNMSYDEAKSDLMDKRVERKAELREIIKDERIANGKKGVGDHSFKQQVKDRAFR